MSGMAVLSAEATVAHFFGLVSHEEEVLLCALPPSDNLWKRWSFVGSTPKSAGRMGGESGDYFSTPAHTLSLSCNQI